MISKNLLSSQARIQIPWVKVTIGNYTFGVFDVKSVEKDNNGFYTSYGVQYPNYITGLTVVKINGQVNQYTLNIVYPVRPTDDPNFFEKVFSYAGSRTQRKITFSYGDMSMPSYIYKDEEAIITKIGTNFDIVNGVINYTVSATSIGALGASSCDTFIGGVFKPSDRIKEIFRQDRCKIRSKLFTGMSIDTIDRFIVGDDKPVEIKTKENTSIIDYINYLVSCMVPAGSGTDNTSKEIYILTIHDDQVYDYSLNGSVESKIDATEVITLDGGQVTGPYFKVSKISYVKDQADAYNIDIGINTSTIVTQFGISNDESYAIYYDYQGDVSNNAYVKRINNNGQWEDEYAPVISSRNDQHKNYTADTTWWTKITKYPINATITVQGLLRPANLMTYVRLNVIFPGGQKHISSGLYLVTKQTDTINAQGYKTQLALTRIGGDYNATPVNAWSNYN